MSPQKKTPKATQHSLKGVARRELGIELDKRHQRVTGAASCPPTCSSTPLMMSWYCSRWRRRWRQRWKTPDSRRSRRSSIGRFWLWSG